MRQWEYGSNSILSAASSTRKYFGLDSGYPSSPVIDRWLAEHSFRCVIVLLVDAMGVSILKDHFRETDFLRSHMVHQLDTVFPTATTAATTALRTGRAPGETGWVGWTQYFREADDQIIPFLSAGMYSGKKYEPHFAEHMLETEFTVDEMNRRGIRAECVWPAWGEVNPCQDFAAVLKKTAELAGEKDVRYIYSYWDRLDSLMHIHGTKAAVVHEELLSVNALCEAFAKELPGDAGVIILADHGQVDCLPVRLYEDQELMDCLNRYPSLEPRVCAFSVKPERAEEFESMFQERYGSEFVLIPSHRIAEAGWFGPVNPEKLRPEFVEDYLCYSIGKQRIACNEKQAKTIGDHGSILEEERKIPLILYP